LIYSAKRELKPEKAHAPHYWGKKKDTEKRKVVNSIALQEITFWGEYGGGKSVVNGPGFTDSSTKAN